MPGRNNRTKFSAFPMLPCRNCCHSGCLRVSELREEKKWKKVQFCPTHTLYDLFTALRLLLEQRNDNELWLFQVSMSLHSKRRLSVQSFFFIAGKNSSNKVNLNRGFRGIPPALFSSLSSIFSIFTTFGCWTEENSRFEHFYQHSSCLTSSNKVSCRNEDEKCFLGKFLSWAYPPVRGKKRFKF